MTRQCAGEFCPLFEQPLKGAGQNGDRRGKSASKGDPVFAKNDPIISIPDYYLYSHYDDDCIIRTCTGDRPLE